MLRGTDGFHPPVSCLWHSKLSSPILHVPEPARAPLFENQWLFPILNPGPAQVPLAPYPKFFSTAPAQTIIMILFPDYSVTPMSLMALGFVSPLLSIKPIDCVSRGFSETQMGSFLSDSLYSCPCHLKYKV